MKLARIRAFVLILTVFLCCVAVAPAQSTEAGILSYLKGKSLFLKGFWNEDKLEFNAEGNPMGNYHQTSFALAGFDVSKVTVAGDKLALDGQRIGIMFDEKNVAQRVKLGRRMHIDIDGNGNIDFTKEIDRIFAEGFTGITPYLPSYWQPYAQKRFILNEPPPDVENIVKNHHPADSGSKTPENNVAHIGGAVKAPRLLSSVAPKYTEAALGQKYTPTIQVFLWVGEDGVPTHLSIARAGGLGLDEQALAAVQQYRFAPATENGKPVKVDLYIDVSFKVSVY